MNTPDARLDLRRRQRLGMVEAVWGEHKTADQIVAILESFAAAGELGFVTRVAPEKAARVCEALPEVARHPDARCLTLGALPPVPAPPAEVVVLSGGSSDRTVVAEISVALRCHGIGVDPVMDVGVAGLHRLLDQLPRLASARILIACAGMEGALPTVLAGLVPQPVIGVPISVGYGISAGGRTALEGMLASCAPGLTVVNIDNGYGAAMAALRMLRGFAPEASS
ncbi:MAG: nickel pincer cofactor biosynthesis protein LarB [Synechococcus sp.]|uniref:nickel pincer cofactor biosynthesis protein LarB n=1 Tax=Synechococcus sp. MU1617 TaxID=2508346 RepID=UPI0017D45D42|nr:nickel pincer cofactor biosynthesis protein LarB [Synechococcus sp.]MCB4390135.1 nickel pincer cofactor biosynthesis protein LarB [Synechococcus sp. MU1617]